MEQDIPDGFGAADAIEPPPLPARQPVAEPPARAGDRRLDVEARRRIGRSLRVLYADVLSQPIPERFELLVAALAIRSGEESA